MRITRFFQLRVLWLGRSLTLFPGFSKAELQPLNVILTPDDSYEQIAYPANGVVKVKKILPDQGIVVVFVFRSLLDYQQALNSGSYTIDLHAAEFWLTSSASGDPQVVRAPIEEVVSNAEATICGDVVAKTRLGHDKLGFDIQINVSLLGFELSALETGDSIRRGENGEPPPASLALPPPPKKKKKTISANDSCPDADMTVQYCPGIPCTKTIFVTDDTMSVIKMTYEGVCYSFWTGHTEPHTTFFCACKKEDIST